MTSPIAIAEVLSLRVRFLADLPLASALVFSCPGLPPLTLTTGPERAREAAERGEVCCTPLEYEALTDALCGGLVTRDEAFEALARKANPMGYRITLEGLVGAHVRQADGRPWECHATRRVLLRAQVPRGRWTFADFCSALGAELVGVE